MSKPQRIALCLLIVLLTAFAWMVFPEATCPADAFDVPMC